MIFLHYFKIIFHTLEAVGCESGRNFQETSEKITPFVSFSAQQVSLNTQVAGEVVQLVRVRHAAPQAVVFNFSGSNNIIKCTNRSKIDAVEAGATLCGLH